MVLRPPISTRTDTLVPFTTHFRSIPSKALRRASELFEQAKSGALARHGVKLGEVGLDLDAMLADKSEAVKGLTGGIEYLFKKNKVEWLKGHAAFTAKDAVKVGDRKIGRASGRERVCQYV